MADQQGDRTDLYLLPGQTIEEMDCCNGVDVVLDLSVDGETVYRSGVVNVMGVELTVHCREHSPLDGAGRAAHDPGHAGAAGAAL